MDLHSIFLFCGTVFLMGEAMCVTAVPKQSWHWGYLRALLVPFLKDFLSFFYFPYTTSFILSFILWFPLVLQLSSLYLCDFSTLLSPLSHSSCPRPSLLALYVVYLEPSLHHLLQRQQCDQEQTSWQIAHNFITQCEAKIQQLQTRNQESTAVSAAYQERELLPFK
jgi:hypothetical protein